MGDVQWSYSVNMGGTSQFDLGNISASPDWITSTSTGNEDFRFNVNGFLITTQPTIDIRRISWQLPSYEAVLDPTSYATYIPNSIYNDVMKELMEDSIGFFWDSDFQMYVLSCD